MPIGIEWQDENGELLARYEGPVIDQKVWSRFPAHGPCLRFVDPYGDAVFNQAQILELVGELNELLTAQQSRELPAGIAALRGFIETAIGQTHTYVKFIGD